MINRRLKSEPTMELTQGEFGGRVGIWRLMDLCDQYGVKLTIFTPGRICELFPESLEEATRRGHEVANHMWEHRIPSEIEPVMNSGTESYFRRSTSLGLKEAFPEKPDSMDAVIDFIFHLKDEINRLSKFREN